MSSTERRQNRSENGVEALCFYLRAVAERNRLRAIALSNRDGLYIAGSGARDLDVLAAIGAAYNAGGGLSNLLQRHDNLHVSDFSVCGADLHVAALGDSQPDLEGTQEALERIMA